MWRLDTPPIGVNCDNVQLLTAVREMVDSGSGDTETDLESHTTHRVSCSLSTAITWYGNYFIVWRLLLYAGVENLLQDHLGSLEP